MPALTLRGNLQLAELFDLSSLRSLTAVTEELRLTNYSSTPSGLEQLTKVKTLNLDTVSNFRLAGFSNLTNLDALILDRARMTDLFGLGGVRNLRRLNIENSQITSLAGLALADRLVQLHIRESTVRDLSALAPLQVVDDLQIVDVSELSSLSGLENLQRAETILIRDNGQLTDMEALNGLVEALTLSIVHNRSLETVDNFRRLEALASLEILDNERLVGAPHLQAIASVANIIISGNANMVEIVLPSLEQLAPFERDVGLGQGGLEIRDNPNLQRISLPRLVSADSIYIVKNEQLATLELDALVSSPGTLSVLLNQRLPPQSLGGLNSVNTQRLKLAGNGGAPTVLTPCPWLSDGFCDETYGICLPSGDAQDCGTF